MNYVAFARACANRSFDLYVVGASGAGLRPLTAGPAQDQWPVWSPDGKRIAFVRGNDQNAELYAVDANGTGLRRLTRNHVEDAVPAWSPDGRLILFASKRASGGKKFQLMTIPSAGGVARSLHGARGGEPAWSPDGKRIAVARAVPGVTVETTNIYVMNADGTVFMSNRADNRATTPPSGSCPRRAAGCGG